MAGFRASFFDQDLDGNHEDGLEIPVVCLVIVVLRNGREVLDALLQLDSTNLEIVNHMMDTRDSDTYSNLTFASDFAKKYTWEHWFLLPPAGASQKLLPIPPGSVRGKWMKPALTNADLNKPIVVVNGAIIVDGEPRNVSWGDSVIPSNFRGTISGFASNHHYMVVGVRVYCQRQDGVPCGFPNPALVGPGGSAIELDLPFASVGGVGNPDTGQLQATFYVPTKTARGTGYTLTPAENVKFEGKSLAGFADAMRHR